MDSGTAARDTATRTEYLALQQEADFALWRAREGNAEVKMAYALHIAGRGPAPGAEQLTQLLALERDAEAKYKRLREFLRHHFGQDVGR